MVNDFVYRAVTDRSLTLFEAQFKRNFIHVNDVVGAFVHCLNNFKKMKDNAYNVGLSDANLSKLELCEEIKKKIPKFCFEEYKKDDWAKDPDQRNYIVSNKKIEATGWKAKVSLEQGIEELIKGYQIIRRNQYGNI
jgi:nucleoside-diphosphate-sugar epimerase